MVFEPGTLAAALASGAAVLAFTWAADRVGGTLGGLLATAPVTTAAALLVLASDLGNVSVGDSALQGGKALFGAIAAMPAYFYVEKYLKDPIPSWLRISIGLVVFMGVFTGGTLLADALTPDGYAWLWMVVCMALVVLYLRTFFQAHIPPRLLRGRRPALSWPEALARFAAGVLVVFLVTWLREVNGVLATAWAVFPGTFLVTLGVLGYRNGAAFSARAAQGGALGVPPLIGYLLVIHFALPLSEATWWTWAAQVPAWAVYFALLWPLWKWQHRLRPKRLEARGESSGA